MTAAKEVALPNLWCRWKQIEDEFAQRPDETVAASEQRQGHLSKESGAVEREILRTTARTIADVLVKLRLADAVVWGNHTFHGVLNEEPLELSDRLVLAACAGLDRLPGEAGGDPLVALWARHRDLNGQHAPEGATVEESDHFQ